MRKYLLRLIPAALLSVGAQAQSPATMPAGTPTAEVDPIRCWWRSSAGSVRSGETLLVGLTCAVLDNEAEQIKQAGVPDVETFAREGDPADAILDVAEEKGADLIVVGNKGMTGARRFLLGSVPNKVSHHAPCNVMIVRTT